MSTLRELRDTLLTISHPEKWLALADDYLDRFETQGDDFILPREHAMLAPILEHYVGDLAGWMKFARGVRDRLPRYSMEYSAVHEFFSKLESRFIVRRDRRLTGLAVDVAIATKVLPDTKDDKRRYIDRCRQLWKKRRAAVLGAARRASPTGRVSLGHQEELLAEFWEQLETELNNGEIPPP